VLPKLVVWLNKPARDKRTKNQTVWSEDNVFRASMKLAQTLDVMLKAKARRRVHKPRHNTWVMEARCLCDNTCPELKFHRPDPQAGLTSCTGCGEVVSMSELRGHAQYQGIDDETGKDTRLHGAPVDTNHSEWYNFKTFGGGEIKASRGEGVMTTTDEYKDAMISDARRIIKQVVESLVLNAGCIHKAVELFATYRWAEDRVRNVDLVIASCILLSHALHTETQRARPNARAERIARIHAGVAARKRRAELGGSGGGTFKSKGRVGHAIVRNRPDRPGRPLRKALAASLDSDERTPPGGRGAIEFITSDQAVLRPNQLEGTTNGEGAEPGNLVEGRLVYDFDGAGEGDVDCDFDWGFLESP